MKFTCTQENLLNGLQQVVPIAGKNTQLPILQHILLRARENVLHLTTTNLEVGVHVIIGGKMETEGGCTIPARMFTDYISQLPNLDPITIEKQENQFSVSTKGYHAKFVVGDPDEFPLIPSGKQKDAIKIPILFVAGLMRRVLFAASREDTRTEIKSVYIRSEQGMLRIAATDSFRLAEDSISLEGSHSFTMLLPLNSAHDLIHLFQGHEYGSLAVYDNHIMVYGDGIEFSSRLIDGTYPDYEQIIPKSHSTSFTVSSPELIQGLKTLSVFLPRDSRRVTLSIRVNKGELAASVLGRDTGEATMACLIEGKGNDVEIVVNMLYLLEGLQRVVGDSCTISLRGSDDPILITPTKKDERFRYVVMPIQAQ